MKKKNAAEKATQPAKVLAAYPTPHGEKLRALRANPKLPESDRPRVDEALKRYSKWVARLDACSGQASALLSEMLQATNDYKRFIEFDLIFQSGEDFLYRQKGQLKIDNTILEEFLPRLVDHRLVPGLASVGHVIGGPAQCFSGFFIGPLGTPLADGGVFVKSKNQDFAVGRRLFLKASTDESFKGPDTFDIALNVGYFAAELKTNLDKTMFQEAEATARELKQAVLGAEYVLLCEWLDMPPIDTRLTSIDEVILLRKAKRLGSGVRAEFDKASRRRELASVFAKHLDDHPLALPSFERLVKKLQVAFPEQTSPDEGTVLTRGYF